MVDNNPKIAEPTKVAKPPRPLYMTLLIWVVIPLLVIIFIETFILFVGGMVPTIVAYMVDPSAKKQITRTVGYANVTGCFIVALDMWTYNNTVDKALSLMSDPANWLIMFGTASFGWLLYFIMRPLIATYLTVTFDVRRKRMQDVEEKLIAEWGDEVKKNAPVVTPDMLAEDEKAIKDGLAQMNKNGKAAAGKVATAKTADGKAAEEKPAPPSNDAGS